MNIKDFNSLQEIHFALWNYCAKNNQSILNGDKSIAELRIDFLTSVYGSQAYHFWKEHFFDILCWLVKNYAQYKNIVYRKCKDCPLTKIDNACAMENSAYIKAYDGDLASIKKIRNINLAAFYTEKELADLWQILQEQLNNA